MRIEAIDGSGMSLEEWGQKRGLTLVARERGLGDGRGVARWYVHFDNVEVVDGSLLLGEHGNGGTPEMAAANYAGKIAGRRIVHCAYRKDRAEFQCPNEWGAN